MTNESAKIIHEIEDAARGTNKISGSRVKHWLSDPSIEVLGAVTQHVIRNSRRVEPPLSMEEICNTVQRYYEACLVHNIQSCEYAPNRSVAGYELVGWFRSLWRDPAVPRDYLVRLKVMIGGLCLDNKVSDDQMAGAVLEHLFETPEIAEFFSDWKTNPLLSRAFTLAMDWDGEVGSGSTSDIG